MDAMNNIHLPADTTVCEGNIILLPHVGNERSLALRWDASKNYGTYMLTGAGRHMDELEYMLNARPHIPSY